MRRRTLVLAAAAAPWAARGADARSPVTAIGLFALMGDELEVMISSSAADTRLNRGERRVLNIKNSGFDQAALRATRQVLSSARPGAAVHMYQASAPLTVAEQRKLADDAAEGGLPRWIVQLIEQNKLSHVLLITRQRGEAMLRTGDGQSLGQGMVEGMGFYLDNDLEIRARESGVVTRGFLGPYSYFRLTLLDTRTAEALSHDIRDGRVLGARNVDQSINPWDMLDAYEKTDMLREMIERNVGRVLPALLEGRKP